MKVEYASRILFPFFITVALGIFLCQSAIAQEGTIPDGDPITEPKEPGEPNLPPMDPDEPASPNDDDDSNANNGGMNGEDPENPGGGMDGSESGGDGMEEPGEPLVFCPGVYPDGRTQEVVDALVAAVPEANSCEDLTAADLASLNSLSLSGKGITALQAGDFTGLTNLRELNLGLNSLTELPEGLFAGLTNLSRLDLNGNRLTTLDASSFAGIENLLVLNLSDNRIQTIEGDTFHAFRQLAAIEMNMNELTAFYPETFEGLSTLQILTLWDNDLLGLHADTFKDLTDLRVLNLWGNDLTVLPPSLFHPTVNLRYIGLGANPLKVLDATQFQGLIHLQFLNLEGADLIRLDAKLFKDLKSLTNLNLWGNKLTYLPPSLFSGLDKLEFLGLWGNQLISVPLDLIEDLPSLQDLRLNGNQLVNLEEFLSRLTTPIFIDVTGSSSSLLTLITNPLDSITISEGQDSSYSIQLLSQPVNNAAITPVSTSPILTFSPEKLLFTPDNWRTPQTVTVIAGNDDDVEDETLFIRHAIKVQAVASTTTESLIASVLDDDELMLNCPDSLLHGRTLIVANAIIDQVDGVADCADITAEHLAAIEELDLSEQKLNVLLSGDFAGLSGLKSLSLYRNRLAELPSDIFSGLTNLERLEIDRNDLVSLPGELFADLTKLRLLYVGGNPLKSVPLELFSGLNQLTLLSLSYTPLSALPPDLFVDLTELRSLILRNNQLVSLPEGTFAGLSGLKNLWLDGNQLTGLLPIELGELANLEFLSMNHNPFYFLPSDVFAGLAQLNWLDLQSCGLTEIDAALFTVLTKLRTLSLSRNDLKDLPADLFADQKNLKTLDLNGNNLTSQAVTETVPLIQGRGIAVTFDPTPHGALLNISGNHQTVVARNTLENPFVVQVIEGLGTPLPGLNIAFQVLEGGGTLDTNLVPTDAEGKASAVLTSGLAAGFNVVEASVVGLPLRTLFIAEATPYTNQAPSLTGELENLELIAGDPYKNVPVDGLFSDPENEGIQLSASSDSPGVAGAVIVGDRLRLDPHEAGTAVVTVVAVDPHEASASVSFDLTVVARQPTDYDLDDDGLIEVSNLFQLNAIRWDLDGNGRADHPDSDNFYALAYPSAVRNMGCPDGDCLGYELMADLDFDTDQNGVIDSGDHWWNARKGWQPIGTPSAPYTGILAGNGHTIVNLHINRTTLSGIGLFGAVGTAGSVTDLHLTRSLIRGQHWTGSLAGVNHGTVADCSSEDSNIAGNSTVGGLIGHNFGSIHTSYSAGVIVGNSLPGGLTGWNSGTLAASYAQGIVRGHSAGGLASRNFGSIAICYSAVSISGKNAGGLTGEDFGRIEASYFDSDLSEITGLLGKTTAQLQEPVEAIGVYELWTSYDLDEDGNPDSPWNFGDATQYPSLD